MSYINRPHLRPALLKTAAFAAVLMLAPGCSFAPLSIRAEKQIEGCVVKKSYEPSRGATPDKLILETSTDLYGRKNIIAAGIEQVQEADSRYGPADRVRIVIEYGDLSLAPTNYEQRRRRVSDRTERIAGYKELTLGGSQEGLVRLELMESASAICTG